MSAPHPPGVGQAVATQPGAAKIRNLGESPVGLRGFPDAPSHSTPGAPKGLPSPPFPPTCLPMPAASSCRPRWPGALRSWAPPQGSGSRVSQAQDSGLRAGARVALRRASERRRGGPHSWRSEQRACAPGLPPPSLCRSVRELPWVRESGGGGPGPEAQRRGLRDCREGSLRPRRWRWGWGGGQGRARRPRGRAGVWAGLGWRRGTARCCGERPGGGAGGAAEPPRRGAGGRGPGRRGPRGPGALGPGAGAAAQWQEAEPRALSGGRRRPPLPPAAMGTGPGVSGRRAASRPDPELSCRAGGHARDGEGQVRGAGGRGGGRAAAGPAGCFPTPRPSGPGGGGGRPVLSLLCLGLPPDTPAAPRPCAGAPPSLPLSGPCHSPLLPPLAPALVRVGNSDFWSEF